METETEMMVTSTTRLNFGKRQKKRGAACAVSLARTLIDEPRTAAARNGRKDHSLETCSARLFRSTDDPIGSISKHGFGSCSESRLGDLRIRHNARLLLFA